MSPQKSHFAYRLAWENSSGERIPYIPLHRRDLVAAADGNSTFVGDKKKTDSALAPHPGVSVFHGLAGSRDSKEAPPGGVTGKERINWRKFEIMGEVIVGVQRAQGTPYPNLPKCEEVRNLVLDVKISKDEDVSSTIQLKFHTNISRNSTTAARTWKHQVPARKEDSLNGSESVSASVPY